MSKVLCVQFNSFAGSKAESFEKPKFNWITYFFAFLIFLLSFNTASAQELSPITHAAFQKFKKVDSELGDYGTRVSEYVLNCSYLQDIWLAYLHDAENQEEFYRGMQLFQDNSRCFQSVCRYITTVFNFYTGESEYPSPQEIETTFKGKTVLGFLNTFKVGRTLTAAERAEFFNQENVKFLQDAITFPFVLDASSIYKLEANTIYNFVLLQDGTIRASLERPGDREYQVRDEIVFEAFKYPNHTILAGDPEQVVITAGALILHQVGDKRLYFVSSKSGHFQPDYDSLSHLRAQLSEVGIKPCTVVPVPDIDMSRAVIKTYKGAQAPVLLTQADIARLFQIASDRWEKTYLEIDRELLKRLANGDESLLSRELTLFLKKQRAEATYMRSAYHLFAAEHQSPPFFGEFVKQFGKLKDATKRYGTDRFNMELVKTKASLVLDLLHEYEKERLTDEFIPADDRSFYEILNANISEMHNLLSRKNLDLEEYHQLKKLSRETGALFLYMADDREYKGKGHLISRTVADGFFQINDLMAQTDYIYDEKGPDGEKRVIVPRKIANLIIKYLSHLGIAPANFNFKIDSKEAWWMINNSKGMDGIYSSSAYMFKVFYDIENGTIDGLNIDYVEGLSDLKTMKRRAEFARNVWIFLDKSRKVPELFLNFMDATDRMIIAYEQQNFSKIKKEANSFSKLCRYAPSEMLENWKCTDQESFDQTLQLNLQGLKELQANQYLSHTHLKELKESVQAFRDFINSNRRNGLFVGEKPTEHLPMICFDVLEERADVLLEEMERSLKNSLNRVLITSEMASQANFILSRCSTN